MVQIIRSDDAKNFACPHCGTIYEINWSSPAHDSGSMECEICYEIMVRWKDCAIPSLRVKDVQSMMTQCYAGESCAIDPSTIKESVLDEAGEILLAECVPPETTGSRLL
jgi:hypothetical protein